MKFSRAALPAILGLSLISAFGCATSGGSAPPSRNVILNSDFDDAKLGAEAAKAMEEQMGVVDDPRLQAYIEAIGRRMLPFAPVRSFDYSFHIVDQAAPNAFALPGGYIYISRGLLTLVNSEDELACVIGHEITHAAERHSAGRQQFDMRMNPLSIGFIRMGRLAAYGRDQESDADRGGQILAAKAGWDPAGMATFMQDIDAMGRLTTGWSRLPGFFDSHPSSPQRAAASTNRAENLQWTPPSEHRSGSSGFSDENRRPGSGRRPQGRNLRRQSIPPQRSRFQPALSGRLAAVQQSRRGRRDCTRRQGPYRASSGRARR